MRLRKGTDGENYILIGDTSTVWRYPVISIDVDAQGYATPDLGDGWGVEITGTEPGSQHTATPSISVYGYNAEVSGDISYAGTLYATGADLAENFRTKETNLEPGMVVELDPDNEKHVRKSTTAHSTLAIGVVTTDPAMVLGQDIEGIAVALTGQVPVRVKGKVEVGDWLVSSDEPGYAQACKIKQLVEGDWSILQHNENCRNAGFAKAMESGQDKTITAVI